MQLEASFYSHFIHYTRKSLIGKKKNYIYIYGKLTCLGYIMHLTFLKILIPHISGKLFCECARHENLGKLFMYFIMKNRMNVFLKNIHQRPLPASFSTFRQSKGPLPFD